MTLPSGRTTNIIAIATLLVFLVLEMGGLTSQAAVLAGFIPARVEGIGIAQSADLPWLPMIVTPLSATLVHGGWLHIGFNMLMLVFCGRHVEQVIGRWPIVILYVAGAYAAAAAQWLTDPASTTPMVGASGAISALMGTYALLYSRQAVNAVGPIPASVVRVLWLAAGWVILQAMIGFAMQSEGTPVAVGAHVGGFIAGLLLTRPLLRWRFRSMAHRGQWFVGPTWVSTHRSAESPQSWGNRKTIAYRLLHQLTEIK